MVRYRLDEGSYDENNQWVDGRLRKKNIWGVIKTGNKLSKSEEGEALHAEDGGERFSDYKTLYVTDRFPVLATDKIGFNGRYYNVLQRSNEAVFGFYSVTLERTVEWTP